MAELKYYVIGHNSGNLPTGYFFKPLQKLVIQTCYQTSLSSQPTKPRALMSDAAFFTFTGLRGLADSAPPAAFKVTKASTMEFPALLGLGVSYALLQYPVGSIHTHPRGTELLYVLEGSLKVGLVDSKNVLYVQNIKKGDMFVFPKVLVHFQLNTDSKRPAVALSAFSSANAGTVSLPGTLFATGIENSALAMTFKTDVKTIQKLKAGLVSKG